MRATSNGRPFFFSSRRHPLSSNFNFMGFLDDIEPLKQTARAELTAAPDLAALEQTKGTWIGPNGKFTALMKQLGTLSKEEKPAAGKLINAAKVELEAALAARLIGAKTVIPVHFGTFPILTGTPAELADLVKADGVHVWELQPGTAVRW